MKNISWTFVCQAGHLEFEASLLAASLRESLGEKANIIAAIPQPEDIFGKVSADVISYLKSLNVRIEYFNNDIVNDNSHLPIEELNKKYFMMNKAYALNIENNQHINVFLDSDHLCFAPFDPQNLQIEFVGRIVGYPGSHAVRHAWKRAYDLCDTAIPNQRQLINSDCNTKTPLIMPTYFNGGFISIHREWLQEFVGNYVECFKTIHSNDILGEDRFFEEQISLSVAVIKTGIPYYMDLWRINNSFLHYVNMYVIKQTNKLPYIKKLCECNELRDIMIQDKKWKSLLQ